MLELRLLSSLAKVFYRDAPPERLEKEWLSALSGERVSLQAAYKQNVGSGYIWGCLKVEAPEGVDVTVRRVRYMPGNIPPRYRKDDGYLRTDDGLYPDLLEPFEKGNEWVHLLSGTWQSIWIDLQLSASAKPGKYPIIVQISSKEGEVLNRAEAILEIIGEDLPPLAIPRISWFHTDCLAQYYNEDVFSEKHWEIIENFAAYSVQHGINSLLTPIHTPPLDMEVGGERLTTQLLDVTVTDNGYKFGFEKLERWVKMCIRIGVEYIEMAHLFTQWGAKHAPKIMGTKDGKYIRLFGWETDATGDEYSAYLNHMLPALITKLKEWGIAEKVIFHISDEPRLEHLENYKAARAIVNPLLEGFKIVDALTDYNFYKEGALSVPISSVEHITPFIEKKVPELWCYYCSAESYKVPNHFFMQPSYRNRILGVLLYKYNIAGFLHWGFNFYNCVYSVYPINPFRITDADGSFPSGDSFMVYPGADGKPLASLRLLVAQEGFNDLRALRLLEKKIGREAVLDLIDENLAEPITFSSFPQNEEYILFLRQKVNKLIRDLKETL